MLFEVCLGIAALLAVTTTLLIALPTRSGELRLWRRLRVQDWRRRITRRRQLAARLDPAVTLSTAKANLLWHLFLNVLFVMLMVRALVAPVAWWRALAGPLVIPCLAWFVGSLVQRQLIAIVQLRLRRPC